MNGNVMVLAYAACGLLIVVYAWGWSNVPPPNLRLILLVYLALGGPLFAHAAGGMHQQPGGLMVAGKIAHVQLVTIGMSVWLMQRHAHFNRLAGDAPPFSATLPTASSQLWRPRGSAFSSIRGTPTRWLARDTTCEGSCSAFRYALRQHFSATTGPGTRPALRDYAMSKLLAAYR